MRESSSGHPISSCAESAVERTMYFTVAKDRYLVSAKEASQEGIQLSEYTEGSKWDQQGGVHIYSDLDTS
jgi:hypothetical protein